VSTFFTSMAITTRSFTSVRLRKHQRFGTGIDIIIIVMMLTDIMRVLGLRLFGSEFTSLTHRLFNQCSPS
jgi:hypothetical protein